MQEWEFPFVVYKDVFRLQIVEALCCFSSLFIKKDGSKLKVHKSKQEFTAQMLHVFLGEIMEVI